MDKFLKAFFIVVGLFCLIFILLWGLGDTLIPLLMSFALSYLLFPLIKKLESKGIKRSLAVGGVFTGFIVMIALLVGLILPSLVMDIHLFLKELPENSSKAIEKIEALALTFNYNIDLSRDSVFHFIKDHVSEFSTGLLKAITKGIKSSFTGLAKWLIALLNIFLIPLFFFFVINDYEKISQEIKSYIPKSLQEKLTHYQKLGNQVLSGYIRGQLMVALCLAFLYALGLSLVGLRFGILIGLISGLLSIIPYVGFSIGFISAIVIGLSNDMGLLNLVMVSCVFIVVQALEGFVITPKLVGDKVGLSSLSTMLSLIIGGNLFGLVGMLIAIPIAAIMKTLIGDLKAQYQQLDFYRN